MCLAVKDDFRSNRTIGNWTLRLNECWPINSGNCCLTVISSDNSLSVTRSHAMRLPQLVKLMFLAAMIFIFARNVLAQSDGEKFAEGRMAMDKFNDCPAAVKALESVSEAGRQNPLWIAYMAKAYECVGNAKDALTYYEKYNQVVPGNGEIVDKIGELRYMARKEIEELEQSQKRAKDLRWMSSNIPVTGKMVENVCRFDYYGGDLRPYSGCVIATENGIVILNWREQVTKYDFLISATTNTGKWEPFDEKKKNKLLSTAWMIGERRGRRTYLCRLSIYTGWFDEDSFTCFAPMLKDNWRDYEDNNSKYYVNKGKVFDVFIP